MTPQSFNGFYDVLEQTWPPAAKRRVGPWAIRQGLGGGQRVSATSAESQFNEGDLNDAEQAMTALAQDHLFVVREGENKLDNLLDQQGYRIKDPVSFYACPTETLIGTSPKQDTTYSVWPPLHIMYDIWIAGSTGPARHAIMHRAKGRKTALLARQDGRAAGVAFVATHGDNAMIHALEVLPATRRQGVAKNIMRAAAIWAQENGATKISLAVTDKNLAANTLYRGLGMIVEGHYHYRLKRAHNLELGQA